MTVSLWCRREVFKIILNYSVLTSQKLLKLSQEWNFLLNIPWKKQIFQSTPQETNYQDFQITRRQIKGSLLLYFVYVKHFLSESSNVVAVTAKAPFMLCSNFWNFFVACLLSLLCRTFLHYHFFPFTWKNAQITAKGQIRSISLSYWLFKRK